MHTHTHTKAVESSYDCAYKEIKNRLFSDNGSGTILIFGMLSK